MVFGWENGSTPSMAILNPRLRTYSLNFSSHISSICFMVIKFVGIRNTPSSLRRNACHPCNITNFFQWKRLWILGIIGMCVNILWGGPCSLPLFFDLWYLSCPHFGHISLSTYSPLYRIQSFGHAWYDMICTQQPTFSTFALPLCSF